VVPDPTGDGGSFGATGESMMQVQSGRGTVVALDAGPPPTVTITGVGDTAAYPGLATGGCRYLRGYLPILGDHICWTTDGVDIIVLGLDPYEYLA
jgi:hypothetical protein